MKIEITEDIYLSEFKEGDQVALVEYLAEKEISDRTKNIPHPYTEEDANWWVAHKIKETEEQGQPVSFAIREQTGKPIGSIGLDGLKIGTTHKKEMGYWLAKPYWGKDIMTKVCARLCEHAFTEFKLTKIFATCLPENIGSARVMEKCGFDQEGYLKKDMIKNGEFRDSKLYALIK